MGSKKTKSDLSLFGNSALLNRNRIYNLGIRKKPAELFRKDLISAMKLPDSDQLNPEDYLTIQDPWKEEWEKGVQVPVNPDALAPDASVRLIPESERIKHPLNTSSDDENKDASHNQLPNKQHTTSSSPSTHHHQHQHQHQHHHHHQQQQQLQQHQVTQFKMPKKLLKFEPERDEICSRYEIDLTDLCWLESIAESDVVIREDFFEDVMNELEVQCSTNMKAKHVGIEFDDHIVCDICRSPDAEDGNEMVFCDSCNICVHQACYGITVIPDDEWLCRPCREGKKSVTCILCPNLGGAFKPTSSGNSWAHVACALWIPEVSIGNVTTMEPVTKIKSIPASRWNLVCSVCNVKTGAPIQCSYKTCKTAYHVTCAFNEKLKMKAIVDDESNGGVKLKSYCQRHSDEAKPLLNESDDESGNLNANVDDKNKGTKTHQEFEIASEAAVESEKNNRFWMYIDINEINQMLVPRFQEKYKDMSNKTILFHIDIIQQYWKLKRTSNFGMPLIKVVTHDTIEEIQMAHRSDILKLRVNLERIRNLSYMIIRREKLKRTWLQSHRSLIEKALAYALGIDDLSEHFNNVKEEPKECNTVAPSSTSKSSPCKSTVTSSPSKVTSPNNNLTLNFISPETSSLVKNIINSSVIYENLNDTQVEVDKARVKRIMKELNRLTKINQLRRRIPNPYVREYSYSKCFAKSSSSSSSNSNNNCNSIEHHKTPPTSHSFRNTDESDEESIFEPKVTRSRHTSMENKGHLHHTLNGAGILGSTSPKGSSSSAISASASALPVKIKSEPNTSPHRSTSPTYLQKHSHQLQQLNNQNLNCKSPNSHHHQHNSSSHRSSSHHGQESPTHQASSSSPNCKKLTRSSVNNECKKYNGLRSNDLQSTEESGFFKKFF